MKNTTNELLKLERDRMDSWNARRSRIEKAGFDKFWRLKSDPTLHPKTSTSNH